MEKTAFSLYLYMYVFVFVHKFIFKEINCKLYIFIRKKKKIEGLKFWFFKIKFF